MSEYLRISNDSLSVEFSIDPRNKTEWDAMLLFFGLDEPGRYAEFLGRDLWTQREERLSNAG